METRDTKLGEIGGGKALANIYRELPKETKAYLRGFINTVLSSLATNKDAAEIIVANAVLYAYTLALVFYDQDKEAVDRGIEKGVAK